MSYNCRESINIINAITIRIHYIEDDWCTFPLYELRANVMCPWSEHILRVLPNFEIAFILSFSHSLLLIIRFYWFFRSFDRQMVGTRTRSPLQPMREMANNDKHENTEKINENERESKRNGICTYAVSNWTEGTKEKKRDEGNDNEVECEKWCAVRVYVLDTCCHVVTLDMLGERDVALWQWPINMLYIIMSWTNNTETKTESERGWNAMRNEIKCCNAMVWRQWCGTRAP